MTKNTKTTPINRRTNPRYELPLMDGLTIQHEQMLEWSTKLNAQCYIALRDRAANQNQKLSENASGFDVWRGTDMDEFVNNWTQQQSA